MKSILCALALTVTFVATLPAATFTAPTIAEIVAARVARLTKLLTLTTAQAATATSLFTTEETALATLETSAKTAETALTTAIEANSGVAAAAAALSTIEAQEVLAKATADAGFYFILTTTQQTIDKELLAGGLDTPGLPSDVGHGGGHH